MRINTLYGALPKSYRLSGLGASQKASSFKVVIWLQGKIMSVKGLLLPKYYTPAQDVRRTWFDELHSAIYFDFVTSCTIL